jgi:8-oxo-dGTP pyrophosphatase MutT (NUDIX family)
MKINEFMNLPTLKEKRVSAALFLTDGHVFLAVRPTGETTTYDLPKGRANPGENLKDTVVREIEEETGLDISRYKSQLIDMGRFMYRPEKDVHVFMLKMDNLPSTSSMTCRSMFNFGGKMEPEVDDYKYVPYDNLNRFNPMMKRIIQSVLIRDSIK